MTALLEIQDLKVRFHTLEGVVHAVNGISYSLDAGETLGIVGESGCGKSVSVLSMMQLIPDPPGKVTSNYIRFDGRNLLDLDEKGIQDIRGKDIAMVFQDPMTSLNPVLTIGKQVSEILVAHEGMDREASRERTVELLNMVGIPNGDERINDYPHQFSGGMRQRVMIAMALACMPSLLIADEPTTALDVTIQAQIISLVKQLKDQLNMAIIWITHDLAVIAELADRVLVMYAGFIVEETDVFRLFEEPRHPYTLALLESLPRVDQNIDERLATISGSPPNGLILPPGCSFAPRCPYAFDRCTKERPTLQVVHPNHQVACWVDVRTARK